MSDVVPEFDAIDEEAARWLLRSVDPAMRAPADFPDRQAWLRDAPGNAERLVRMDRLWDDLDMLRPPVQPRARKIALHYRALAAMAVSVVLALFAIVLLQPTSSDYSTKVGEQRLIALEDGSRVLLNTDSKLEVTFEDDRRTLRLDRGEALFDVASDRTRPFTVAFGSARVTAVGTNFVVRRRDSAGSVTLIEGLVDVSLGGATARTVRLRPGARLSAGQGAARIDRPVLEDAIAWQRGQIVLRDTPLRDAVSEMNRYSARKIVLASGVNPTQRLNGVFNVRETEEFVAMASIYYDLRVQTQDNMLVLRRK